MIYEVGDITKKEMALLHNKVVWITTDAGWHILGKINYESNSVNFASTDEKSDGCGFELDGYRNAYCIFTSDDADDSTDGSFQDLVVFDEDDEIDTYKEDYLWYIFDEDIAILNGDEEDED